MQQLELVVGDAGDGTDFDQADWAGARLLTSPSSAPTDLNVAASSTTEADLSWTGISGATGYNVYRGTVAGGESAVPLNTSPISVTGYSDLGLTVGATYYYVVRAVNVGGAGPASSETSVTMPTSDGSGGGGGGDTFSNGVLTPGSAGWTYVTDGTSSPAENGGGNLVLTEGSHFENELEKTLTLPAGETTNTIEFKYDDLSLDLAPMAAPADAFEVALINPATGQQVEPTFTHPGGTPLDATVDALLNQTSGHSLATGSGTTLDGSAGGADAAPGNGTIDINVNGLAAGTPVLLVVRLVNNDGAGDAGSSQVTLPFAAVAPQITGAAGVDEGTTYSLSLGDAGITTGGWVIIWGDGSVRQAISGDPASVTHTYADGPHDYTVSAWHDGISAAATVPVHVSNVAPIVTPPTAAYLNMGQGLNLQVATFTDPGTLDTHTASIDWGDGTSADVGMVTETQGSGSVFGIHPYAAAGTYTVTVTVTDKDGGTGVGTFSLTVDDPAQHPPVILVPGTPGTLTTITFDDQLNVLDDNYANEMGLFLVDDLQGTVNGLAPTASDGWWRTALTRTVNGQSAKTIVPSGTQPPFETTVSLPGGTMFSLYLVKGYSLAYALSQDTNASTPPSLTSPQVPISFAWDAVNIQPQHQMTFTQLPDGRTQFQIEDPDTDPNTDFDDMVGTITTGAAPSGAGSQKFYVVDPDSSDANASRSSVFAYDVGGSWVDKWGAFNSNGPKFGSPTGVASNAAATLSARRVWVVDAAGDVQVMTMTDPNSNDGFDPRLTLWNAKGTTGGGAGTIVGITVDTSATNSPIWMLDASGKRILEYDNKSGDTVTGNQKAAWAKSLPVEPGSSALPTTPSDIVTGLDASGNRLFYVTDSGSSATDPDSMWVYKLTGTTLSFVATWVLDPANTNSSGVTLNPTGGNDLWITDRSGKVFHYANGRIQGSSTTAIAATDSWTLAVNDSDPEGIADPPVVTLDNPPAISTSGTSITVSGHATADPSTGSLVNGVSVNGTSATIDAAGNFFTNVTVGTGATPVVATATDALGASSTVSATIQGDSITSGIDFSRLSDVSAGVSAAYSETTFDDAQQTLDVGLSATNTGQYTVRSPVIVVVKGISNPAVRASGAAGVTPDGDAYYILQADGSDFTDGQSLNTTLKFYNPTHARFTYHLTFLGHLNVAPVFTTTPIVEAPTGAAYEYDVAAIDAENDPITYSIISGPSGMTIANQPNGAGTYALTWTAGSVGTYAVTLQAKDDHGGVTQQAYILSITTANNHPPVFTSTPIVDAFVGSAYTYNATASDPDFDPLKFENLTMTYTDAGGTVHAPVNAPSLQADGTLQWQPDASEVGDHFNVQLEVSDLVSPGGAEKGGHAFQPYTLVVEQAPENHPPVIISTPPLSLDLPGVSDPSSGNVAPGQINLDLAPQATSDQTVSLTLPTGSTTNKVDVFLLFDNTGSFAPTAPTLISEFPQIIAELESAYPQISFGFGVGRFEDYGSVDYSDGYDHPFYLNQPIITPGESETVGGQTITFDDAISAALQRNPGGDGGDVPESDIEALYQVATGAGFDGNGDGNTTDAGAAGSAAVQAEDDFTDDVPAFDSYMADPTLDELPAAGTLGGVGFRSGALPIILDATDTGTVFEPDPSGATSILGANGVEVPITQFENITRPTTPGDRGATVQQATSALNSLGALVIGLGSDDDDPYYPLESTSDPRQWLEAIATATGAINHSQQTIDSGIPSSVSDGPIEPGDPLFFALDTADEGNGFSLPNAISQAVSSALTSVAYDVDVVSTDPNVQVVNETGVDDNIGPGQTASFDLEFTGDGQSHTFDLNFVRAGTGVVLGSIPVTMNDHYLYPVRAIDPDGDPITYGLLPNATTGEAGGATIDPSTGLMTWNPSNSGTYHFTVTASDGRGGEDEQPFDVVVNLGHVADNNLHFTSTAPTAALVGATYSYDATASDSSDASPLNYYLVSGPGISVGTAIIDRFTGVLSWTPTAAITNQPFTIEVTNGLDKDLQTFYVTSTAVVVASDHPPVFVQPDPQILTAGQRLALQLTATDADNDPLSFDLPSKPAGMAIDPSTGLLVWSTDESDVGVYTVIVRVSDGRGGIALLPLSVTVNSAIQPPLITSTPTGPAVVGRVYEYQVEATDPQSYALEYLLNPDAPSGMSLDPSSGLLSWTPETVDVGTAHIEIQVDDGHGGVATQTFDLPTVEPATFAPPNITSTPPSPAVVGVLYQYPVIASNPDQAPLVFSLGGAIPDGMTIGTQSGLLSWTPLSSQEGSQTFAVTVTGDGGSDTQTITLPVDAAGTPDIAPTITSTPTGPAEADHPYQYQVTASVSNGQSVTFSLGNHPTGMEIDPASGLLNWLPTAADVGTVTFDVVATDARGGSGGQTVTLGVQPDDIPPQITSTPPSPASVGHLYQYQVVATDGAGSPLTFSLTTAPDGMLIDATTGLITWTPTASQQGAQPFTVVATDLLGSSDSQIITLPVVATSAADHPPQITSMPTGPAVAGSPYQYHVTASDPDGDPVTFGLSGAVPAGMVLDPTTGLLTWTPAAALAGTQQTFTVLADDGRGMSVGQLVTLSVVAAGSTDQPPQITSTPTGPAVVGSPYQYQVTATDADGDPITFSLGTGSPSGMTIGQTTGLLNWTPAASDLGTANFEVVASDGRGGLDGQQVQLPVNQADVPPSISSTPPSPAIVGQPYQYQVVASDADGNPITFRLLNAPDGMAIGAGTGLLTWTPSGLQAGSQQFSVVADDGRGGTDQQDVTLPVTVTSANHQPIITSTPSLAASIGQTYYYQITATDADNDPLTYAVDSGGPATMAIDGNLITWTPTNDDVGTHSVAITVSDGRDGFAHQTFALQVYAQAQKGSLPTIISAPPTTDVVGQQYQYNAHATDADGQPVTWQLLAGPKGMVINAATGSVVWTPSADAIGPNSISIVAADPRGLSAEQDFTLTVSGAAAPPKITSTPLTNGSVASQYIYDVIATDAANNPLTYSLLGSIPTGMGINPTSGKVTWTPTVTGMFAVDVHVDDGHGGDVDQTYVISVSQTAALQPPVITPTPVTQPVVGQPWQYQVIASAPGETITFSLAGSPPSGLAIDSSSGLVSWATPQAGSYPVEVFASTAGGQAGETFTLVPKVDQAPSFSSSPVTTVTGGASYQYAVLATAYNSGDRLVYSLANAPTGMTVDTYGRITWSTTPADVGTYSGLTITATDSFGLSNSQTYSLSVTADTQAPTVIVEASSSRFPVGSPVTFQVLATDDVGVTGMTLSINGTAVLLSANGTATYTPTAYGDVTAVATATDAAGNVGTGSTTVQAYDPNVSDAPTVAISSPVDDSSGNAPTIQAPTAIVGQVSQPDGTGVTWTLSVAPADGSGTSTIFANGSGPVNGTLGTFDPTMLPNGDYAITLTATNAGDLTSSTEQDVSVNGQLKLGDFSLSFNDLNVPVGGLPVSITRTYDSLNAATSGDFGYGWTMAYRDVTLQTTQLSPGTQAGFGGYSGFEVGTRVWVTLPGGKREMFTFEPQTYGGDDGNPFQALFTQYYTPAFTPAPGVTDKLTVDPAYLETPDGSQAGPGSQLVDSGSYDAYNPANPEFGGHYVLTTTQGVKYDIDAASGTLTSISDRAGDKLNLSDSSITDTAPDGSTLAKITFTRDYLNRITAITDPSGNSLTYTYDSNGNLASFTDASGKETQYQYTVPTRPHFLSAIIDASGNTVLQAQFNSTTGRLSGLINASGQMVPLSYDLSSMPGQFAESTADALQFTTTVVSDSFGNVIRTIKQIDDATDPTYQVVVSTYDTNNDLTAQSNPFDTTYNTSFTAMPTSWAQQDTYDTLGNQLTSTDAMGNITRNAYNSYGQLTSQTDPLGNTTIYQYDGSGNLVSTTDPAGNETTDVYNAKGNLTATYNAAGMLVGSFAYDAAGRLSSETDGSGKTTTLSYDPNGNQLGSSFVWTDPTDPSNTQTVTTGTTYNAAGQPIDTTDEFGHVTHTDYNADGQVIDTIDAEGEETKYVYDVNGNTIQTQNSDGTITDTVYDADNRVMWTDDAHLPGQTAKGTHTIYDGLGNVVETDRVDNVVIAVTTTNGVSQSKLTSSGSVLTSSTTTYNPDGSVASTTDTSGLTTSYTYDADGRQLTVTEQNVLVWDAGTQKNVSLNLITTYTYDAAGRQISVTDPLRHVTAYLYDADGRVIKTTYADGSTTSTTYDANGNKSRETDQLGRTTNYKYNSAGELTEVDQPQVPDANNGNALATPATTYTYDNYGNELTQTDADGHETTFTYDAFGNQLTRKLPDGEVESFTYDNYGRQATHTDFDGNVSTNTYDTLGRLTQVTYTAAPGSGKVGQTVNYTYNGLGQQQTIDDSSVGTTTDSYDANGNFVEESTPEGDIHYVYNNQGQETEVYTADTDTRYGYDTLGRLSNVTLKKLNGVTLGTPLVTTYGYDRDGNLAEETLPTNGTNVTTAYSYDTLDRLISLTEQNGSITLFSQTYTLNADGTRASSQESQLQTDGTTAITSTVWTYDALSRLTGETVTSSLPNGSYADTYIYDLVGNRLGKSHTSGGTTETTTDSYNGDDQLTQEVDTTSGATTFTYDANGSQITSTNNGVTTTYTFNVRNRLASVTSAGTTTIYTYDDAGNRVSETTAGTTTYYLIDANNPTGYPKPIEQWTSTTGDRSTATLSTSYLLGNNVIGQANSSGAVTYLLTDGHGSTRTMIDPSGTVTATFSYDAFGNAIGFNAATAATAYLFGGDGMYDGPSGLVFHGSGRQSNSATGEFIEADPQGYGNNDDPISLHKYLYAGADPVNNWDPSGHDFSLGGELAATGLASTLNSLEFTGFSAAFQTVHGVQAGLNANQVLAGFILGQGISVGLGISAALLGKLFSQLTEGNLIILPTLEGAASPDANAIVRALDFNELQALDTALNGRVPIISATAAEEYLVKGDVTVLENFLQSRGGSIAPQVDPALVKELQAQANLLGRVLKPKDGAVAATGKLLNIPIITRDKRLFRFLKAVGLKVETF